MLQRASEFPSFFSLKNIPAYALATLSLFISRWIFGFFSPFGVVTGARMSVVYKDGSESLL